jgi:hypothetical protein
MTPDTEDADNVRGAVYALLVDNYRGDGPRLEFAVLAETMDAPLAQVTEVCGEIIDAGHADGAGDPVHSIRLNDNGFAAANDAFHLGLLERKKVDRSQ